METFNINTEQRVLAGKSMLRKIKSEGFVPGVLYSAGGSIPISVEEHELKGILNKHGNDVLVKIVHNGKPVTTRIKEIQRDPVTQEIKHIDLMPVDESRDLPGQLH